MRDEWFIRGSVPMTKSEVRAVSISKLELKPDSILWDIGAGTGSVAVEAAYFCPAGHVYAIERNPEAVRLIEENRKKAEHQNVTIIEGTVPECICRPERQESGQKDSGFCQKSPEPSQEGPEQSQGSPKLSQEGSEQSQESLEQSRKNPETGKLPPPTHAFLGGTAGRLEEILDLLLAENPHIRIVINVIALESLSGVLTSLKNREIAPEIVSLTVARAEMAGGLHLMKGQNPVYIISFGGEA